MKLPGLRHLHLYSPNLARATRFYTKVLGARPHPMGGGCLVIGDTDFFISRGRMPKLPPGFHIGFRLSRAAGLAAWKSRLRRARVPFRWTDDGAYKSIQFRDPDGVAIEIYVDRPRPPL